MVILPKKQLVLTHLKTPMAHKTFSQEQFLLKYYYFFSTFKFKLAQTLVPSSINKSIYFLLSLRSSTYLEATNLLEVQKLIFLLKSFDIDYFNLNNYRHL